MASQKDLIERFSNTVAELHTAEKKYIKSFEKMVKASFTDELRKALAPSETDIENHISRLAQILKLLKSKSSKTTSSIHEEQLKLAKEVSGPGKTSSITRDVSILQTAKCICTVKASYYESLFFMATELKLEHPALLLEQSLKDNRNTAGYLSQIEQNIVYPSFKD